LFLCVPLHASVYVNNNNSNRLVNLLGRKELANLDKFREHQKMIEELNVRKKKMLSEAIKQR